MKLKWNTKSMRHKIDDLDYIYFLLNKFINVYFIDQTDKKIVDDPKTVLASESNKKYPRKRSIPIQIKLYIDLDNDMKIENIVIILYYFL